MKNFLLIHGASHGAWCWEQVILELRKRGKNAFAIDLPGHGKDNSSRNNINRQSYIKAVGDFISSLQLEEITLVGHSLAGVILPDVARENSRNIDNVVFLAALVLNKGQTVLDLFPSERQGTFIEMARRSADNTFLSDKQGARQRFFSDLSDEEADVYYSKLTPQPFGVYIDPADTDPDLDGKKGRYILCSQDKTLTRDLCISCVGKLKIIPEEINTGHDPMLSAPRLLVDVLLG